MLSPLHATWIMTSRPPPPKHQLKHKISILPPSSWAKIDLTALFNMDDFHDMSFPQSTPGFLRQSYTVPWHSPQHCTPVSPSSYSSCSSCVSYDDCSSSDSSTWTLSSISQPEDVSSTAPPTYYEPNYFVFPDMKPPPLYLHPFYSRSGLPNEVGDASGDRGTVPLAAAYDSARWLRLEKPLPRLPPCEDRDDDGEKEEEEEAEEALNATAQRIPQDEPAERCRYFKFKALMRGVLWRRLALADRGSDRLPDS
nr:hypothetical protein CFP56_31621 [Quercus suber]